MSEKVTMSLKIIFLTTVPVSEKLSLPTKPLSFKAKFIRRPCTSTFLAFANSDENQKSKFRYYVGRQTRNSLVTSFVDFFLFPYNFKMS